MGNESDLKQRMRVVQWENPLISTRDVTAITGLDFLIRIRDGQIPSSPVARLINYQVVDVGQGYTVIEFCPDESHFNAFSTVHGGIISTVLDSAMTSSVMTTLPVGIACSTIELKINFIRPLTLETGPVRCSAGIIHAGKRIATAQGQLTDKRQGKLFAHGTCTCAIIPVTSGVNPS